MTSLLAADIVEAMLPWAHTPHRLSALSLPLAFFVAAATVQTPTHAGMLGPVEEAERAFEEITVELAEKNYRRASTLTLELVGRLKAQAEATANSGDQKTYMSVACTALEEMLTIRRCADVLAEHAVLQKAGVCPSSPGLDGASASPAECTDSRPVVVTPSVTDPADS